MARTIEDQIREWRDDPLSFFSTQAMVQADWKGEEDFRPASLTEYQKRAVRGIFGRYRNGKRLTERALLSWPKKAGKSWFGAMAALYWACTRYNSKVVLASTSMQLCHENIVKQILRCLETNPWLVEVMGIKDDGFERSRMITVGATASQIIPWASGDAGAAGINWGLCIVDELALFTSNRHRRFFAELTAPSPARRDPLMIVCSYAGWKEQSVDLYAIWKEALDYWCSSGGEARAPYIEVANGDLYASIIQGEEGVLRYVPWYTKDKLEKARKQLPQDYKRMYLNLWIGGQGTMYMFTAGQVEACIDPALGPLSRRTPDIVGPVIISVDYASRWDYCVVAAIGLKRAVKGGKKTVMPYVLDMQAKCGASPYGGDSGSTVPLEWVTRTVLDFYHRFQPAEVICDPWYLEGEIQRWESLGLNVTRYDIRPQIKHSIAAALWNFVAQAHVRFYPKCGAEVDEDTGEYVQRAGRIWDLEEELRTIIVKTHGGGVVFGHVGEKDSPRRTYDDRAFTLALALHHINEHYRSSLDMPEVNVREFTRRMRDAGSHDSPVQTVYAPVVYNDPSDSLRLRIPSPEYGLRGAEYAAFFMPRMSLVDRQRASAGDDALQSLKQKWESVR